MYCYWARPTDACITLEGYDHPRELKENIESLSLAQLCTCENPISPKKVFTDLLTSEGLGLGANYERVIALYGTLNWIRAKDRKAAKGLEFISTVAEIEPKSWKSLLHDGDFVFGYIPYPTELNTLFIHFKDSHVIEIEASVSE